MGDRRVASLTAATRPTTAAAAAPAAPARLTVVGFGALGIRAIGPGNPTVGIAGRRSIVAPARFVPAVRLPRRAVAVAAAVTCRGVGRVIPRRCIAGVAIASAAATTSAAPPPAAPFAAVVVAGGRVGGGVRGRGALAATIETIAVVVSVVEVVRSPRPGIDRRAPALLAPEFLVSAPVTPGTGGDGTGRFGSRPRRRFAGRRGDTQVGGQRIPTRRGRRRRFRLGPLGRTWRRGAGGRSLWLPRFCAGADAQ